MSKVMYTIREDKQHIQKQLGCMNGIFQFFDRHYLLGQRRNGHNQKKLLQGQSDNGKESNNASEKPKAKEKHRVSVESSRNSYSSSCSSLDCRKRVHTEPSSFCPSIVSETSSPTSHIKHDLSADIRDVVKDSMTRKPRGVPVKTVSKDERRGPSMTHVDSPRPLNQPKPVPYDQKDQNLAKLREISRGVKKVKETSRFSYDERESPYKLKSIANMKERPRLSLDSKQSSLKNSINVVDQSQSNEPGSNKRPSSSLVARLMGLEVSNDFINKSETLKTEPSSDEELVFSRLSRKSEESRRAPNKLELPRRRSGSPLTRFPLEPAPWKQELTSKSVYGQIVKRLTEGEFKTSGKDLRALKPIREAIQRTKMKLETEDHKSAQPVSPTIKGTATKPVNQTSDDMVITNLQNKNINHGDRRKYMAGRRSERNLTPIETKATGRTKKPVSPSHTPTVSPRLQKSKNGIDKQSINGIRKQSNGHPKVSSTKIRSMNPPQSTNQSVKYSSQKRSLSQGDTVSFPSDSDGSVASQNELEVTSTYWSKGNKNEFSERLIGYKPMAELAMLNIEQPSPVSVLDAFYSEDPPSPIQKKSYAFKDDGDLSFDEREWTQVGIRNLGSSTELDHSTSEFNQVKLENIKHLVHQIELLKSCSDEPNINPHDGDDIYIEQILLASGFLKNLDCATIIVHLHPTGSLINPELFNVLERTKACTPKAEKVRRKLIFNTVNDMLVQKVAGSAYSGLWTSKRKGSVLNGEKLLKELCSEINNLQTSTCSGMCDEVINIINDDVNKNSEDWDDNCNEVPALVLDIERLIFKILISEVVNAEVSGQKDGSERLRRQLFLV